jgi:hypothetical protein
MFCFETNAKVNIEVKSQKKFSHVYLFGQSKISLITGNDYFYVSGTMTQANRVLGFG